MRYLFALTLIFFLGNSVVGNPATEDLDSLADAAYELVFDDPPVGLELSRKLLMASEEIDYLPGQAKANLTLGMYYRFKGEFDTALDYLSDGFLLLDYLDQGKMNPGIFYQYYGEVFENIGDVERAEQFYREALGYLSTTDKVDQEIACRILLGIFHGRRGQFELALEQFTQALEVTLEQDTSVYRTRQQLIDIYNDLGMLYNLTGEHHQAREFVRRSVAIARRFPPLIPPVLNTLAQIHSAMGQPDSALYYYRQSYQLAKKEGLPIYVANTAQDISGLFSQILRQPDSARFYLQEAINYTRELSDVQETSILSHALARFYLDIQAYDSAYYYAKQGLPVFEEQEDHFMLEKTYDVLWQASQAQGKSEEALNYHQSFKAFSDSVLNHSSDRSYSNLRIRLETLEKQREVEDLENQLLIRKTQAIAFGIITLLLLTIVLVYWLWIKAENRRKKLDLEHSEFKRKSYQDQLEMREQELADHALHMIRKNQFIEEIEQIAKDSLQRNEDQTNLSKRLIKSINLNKSAERDWQDFAKYFGQVHAGFFDALKHEYPKLTSGELRHCALVKMNMSLKESSEIMGVAPTSIKMARYRIKKKLGLKEADDLQLFLAKIFTQTTEMG